MSPRNSLLTEPVALTEIRPAVTAHGLCVMELSRVLLTPTDLLVARGVTAVIGGGTTVSRLVLAYALAGHLPSQRTITGGYLEVMGATTPSARANRSLLALPWRSGTAPETVQRRMAALQWAERRLAAERDPSRILVILSPGLDDLKATDRRRVLNFAQELTVTGATVLVTGETPDRTRPSIGSRSADITVTVI